MRVSTLDGFLVSFHGCRVIRRTSLELNGASQIRILDLFVPLEKDVVHNRTFAHLNDQRSTRLVDANIREQTHCEKALNSSINIIAVESLARANVDIVTDCLRIDARIAAHFNTIDDRGLSSIYRCQRERSSTRSYKSHRHGER